MLPCQRALFEIPEDLAFFNCAFLGPLALSVRKVGEAAVAQKSQPWGLSPVDFFDDCEQLRKRLASLLHTDADNIALTPSASYGLAVAAKNLSLKPGQSVLVLEEQFPSNIYVWQKLAAEKGLTVTTVPRPADGNWTEAIRARLGTTVGLLAAPHCHWVDGGLLDLHALRADLDSLGAALVLDVTQSLGVVELDATALKPDFVVGAGYKWLLGPYTQGFVYADPKYHQGEPIEYNWITRDGAKDFTRIVDYTDAYQAGARRFDMGERSNFINVPMMTAALALIEQWTVPAIAERTRAMTDRIATAAEREGYATLPQALRGPHYLTLDCNDTDMAAELRGRMLHDGVHVSVRGSRLRISPHVYNSDNDVDRVIDALS